jgi:hypothetical protein
MTFDVSAQDGVKLGDRTVTLGLTMCFVGFSATVSRATFTAGKPGVTFAAQVG